MHLSKNVHLLILAGLLFNICAAQNKTAATKRPNIIFVLTDDMGYGDISCFNGELQNTKCRQAGC